MDQTSMAKEAESKSRALKVLVGCFIIVGVEFGTTSVLSNYIGDLCVQMNADLTGVSLMFTIISLASTVVGIGVSTIVDKAPMKLIMLVGCAFYLLFFGCLYFGHSVAVLYIGAACFGVSNICVGFAVAQPLITWWHAKGTAKKISLLSMALYLFAVPLSPAVATLLGVVGYHMTVLLHGGVLGAVMIVCVVFLISDKPERYGLAPYGAEKTADAAGAVWEPVGPTMGQAMRTFAFWAVLAAPICLLVASNGFVSNAATIFQSYGFDAVGAGAMISLLNVFCVVWVLIYGVISDKFGPRVANIVYTVAAILGTVLASFLHGVSGAVCAAAVFGVIGAYSGMVGAVTLGSLFGTRAVGSMIALCSSTQGIGCMLGPVVASSVFDATGSYNLFILVSTAACVAALVLLVAATSKASVAAIKAAEKK